MGVSLEWIRDDVAIARFGHRHLRFGHPYDAAMTIERRGTLAVYKALVVRAGERPDAGHWRMLERMLKASGCTHYAREVARDGAIVRTVTRRLCA